MPPRQVRWGQHYTIIEKRSIGYQWRAYRVVHFLGATSPGKIIAHGWALTEKQAWAAGEAARPRSNRR
jgi:hypothetical protein